MRALSLSLALVLCAAPFATAQYEEPKTDSTSIWQATIRGVSGWSANALAQKAREALKNVAGMEDMVLDTTARITFRTAEGAKPDEGKINEALKAVNSAFKIRKLERRKLDPAAAVVKVKLEGFGWQSSCTSARVAFEKVKGVIIVYAFGDQKTLEIHTKKAGVITEKLVKETFGKNKQLKFISLEETPVEPAN